MAVLRSVFALIFVATGVTAIDFNVHEPATDYHFIYHEQFNLLLTLHDYSCYAAHMDGRLQNSLLQDFQNRLEEVVKAVVESPLDSNRKEPVTEDDFRNRFGDPLADYYCVDKDIYFITLDYLACDFEKYAKPCAWDLDYGHTLQWKRHTGRTPSPLTGPDVDHTLQTEQGSFMYMEANEGSAGDTADLISPYMQVDNSEGLCVRFWYSMYGEDVEKLQAFVRYKTANSPDTHTQLLWSMGKNQGIGWKLAEVTVPGGLSSTDVVQLVLRAHRGSRHYGDIAIDDISSSTGICAPSLLNCSFESTNDPLCHWTQVQFTDKMDWTRTSGPTASGGTGPLQAPQLPHTQNKFYMYLEGDDGQAAYTAELLSPKLYLQGPVCLAFYYYMKGEHLGELEIVQLDQYGRGNIQWTRTSADQTTEWTPAKLTITAPDPKLPIQLKFRAVRGSSPSSDIAIDHISGLSGSCDQYPDVNPSVLPGLIG